MNQLVSVIVPVYKVEKYLRKCLDSILCQTYQNLEIILVDDGSPDSCPQICDEYAKKDSRIVVIHKQNGGQASARNFGLEVCKGDYIAFVDSDDYVSEKYIESLYNCLVENETDIAICDTQQVNEKGKNLSYFKFKFTRSGKLNNKDCLNWLYIDPNAVLIVPWNKLYKREIIKNLRYPNVKAFEDEFMMTDIFVSSPITISILNEKLYYYLIRQSSIMGEVINSERVTIFVDAMRYRLDKTSKDSVYYKFAVNQFLNSFCITYGRLGKENKEIKKQMKNEFKENYQKYKNLGFSLKKRAKYFIFMYCSFILKLLGRI